MFAALLTSMGILLFVTPAQAQANSGLPASAMVLISGRVVYEDGSPVAAASVGVRSFTAHEGILPEPTQTDENGLFSLRYPPWGSGFLYASKPEQGYPDPTIVLYDRRGGADTKLVELASGTKLQGITLKLGHPLPLVRFQVSDANSGAPVRDARIVVKWIDDSDIILSTTMPSNGVFDLLLPEHTVDLDIVAEGFEPWHLRADGRRFVAKSSINSPASIPVRLKRREPPRSN